MHEYTWNTHFKQYCGSQIYSKVFSIKCLPQYFFPSKRDIKGFIALPSIYIYIADKNRQYYEYINNSNLELKYIEKAT